MLFISYWELNPDFDPTEMAEIAETFISKGLYPAEGVTTIGWYMSVSDYWGVSITESESVEAMSRATNMWRVAKPGIFKSFKSSAAMETESLIPTMIKLREDFK